MKYYKIDFKFREISFLMVAFKLNYLKMNAAITGAKNPTQGANLFCIPDDLKPWDENPA